VQQRRLGRSGVYVSEVGIGCNNFAGWQIADAFAREQGHGLLTLAFGWLLSQPVITSVIAGATSPGQVADNVAAARPWRLDEAQLETVAGILAEA